MTYAIYYWATVEVYDSDGELGTSRELRCLTRDDEQAAYEAARTLVESGHGPVDVTERVTKVHTHKMDDHTMRLEEFVKTYIDDKEEGE